MNSTVLPSFHFGMNHQGFAAATANYLVPKDSGNLTANYLVPKDSGNLTVNYLVPKDSGNLNVNNLV